MTTAEIILKRLDEMFPGKSLLTKQDIMTYTGWTYPTINKRLGLSKKKCIDKATFATLLAGGAF